MIKGADPTPPVSTDVRINELALKIGTVNGTGSASANGLLRQAIFRMGIPVSGKNLFPSNIQGLPTWFTLRISGKGYTCRKHELDILIASLPSTMPDGSENALAIWTIPVPSGFISNMSSPSPSSWT